MDSDEAKKHGVTQSPTVLFNPDQYNIQFMGAPLGEEGRSFVSAIMMVSFGKGMLSDSSVNRLKELRGHREIMVFTTPTCPLCPQQVAYGVSAALEVPGKISMKMVESSENRELAEEFSVYSVPQTVVNGNIIAAALQPEDAFIDGVVSGAPVELKAPVSAGEVIEKDAVVIGAGPAGLTAAIYAERSGMKTVVLEKAHIGGQVAITPVVENYPGYTRIPGKTLMDMMTQQAVQYTDIRQGEEVREVRRDRDESFTVVTTANRYRTRTIIIATGAEHKRLGVPGEERFFGRGVSYCATCDGYFFKDGKKVIMVGGGSTAVTEALYLESIGVDVTIVHRRAELRAEERLQENLRGRKIPVLWDTVVEEIMGDAVVDSVKIKNLRDGKVSTMPVDGVFIAVGYVPINDIAKKLGLEMDEGGYIKVDRGQRTSMKGIYAAGDVTGGIKQIVTAVGQGGAAAITAFEDMMNPYWKER